MKKLIFILTFLLTSNAFAERVDVPKMAKKLKRMTGVQIDMNVEKEDKCVYLQLKSLHDQARKFKRAQRKNLKVYFDHHYNKMVVHPTKMMGKMEGEMGKAYLKDEYLYYEVFMGDTIRYKNLAERVVFDNREYVGEENKNTFEDMDGALNIFVAKADMRYTEHSFVMLRKKIVKEHNSLRSVTNQNFADNFKMPIDEISALEASDSEKKVEMGKVECGKLLNFYDFGYDAQYLF